jgi:hypothetical protein
VLFVQLIGPVKDQAARSGKRPNVGPLRLRVPKSCLIRIKFFCWSGSAVMAYNIGNE